MSLPLQVRFRHTQPSEALTELIEAEAARLATLDEQILGCRVLVSPAGKTRRHGNRYEVHITVPIPGGSVEATQVANEATVSKSVALAARAAFTAVRRQLQDHACRQRGAVKFHLEPCLARVSKRFPTEGFGFLETPDGREIYFHRHSVLHDAFDQLCPGTEVTFVEEPGLEGPQASTVRPVGRH